jgi:hypothetical protein
MKPEKERKNMSRNLWYYNINKEQWIEEDNPRRDHPWRSHDYVPSRCFHCSDYYTSCAGLQVKFGENGRASYRCSAYRHFEECEEAGGVLCDWYRNVKNTNNGSEATVHCAHLRAYKTYKDGADGQPTGFTCKCYGRSDSYNPQCCYHPDKEDISCPYGVFIPEYNKNYTEPKPPKTEDEMKSEELMQEILTKYPVRESYADIYEELSAVYELRKELWGKVGVTQGMMFNEFCNIPQPIIDFANIAGKINTLYVSYSINPDKVQFDPQLWRVNMHPGALISAAEKDGALDKSDPRACACLGYKKEYESTALQLSLDPHLIVLEPMKDRKRRRNGFNFMFLGSTGIHSYGSCYCSGGSRVDSYRAKHLAEVFATIVNGWEIDNAEAINETLEGLSAMGYLRPSDCEALQVPIFGNKHPDMVVDENDSNSNHEIWFPLAGSNGATLNPQKKKHYELTGERWDYLDTCYNDARYFGGWFDTGITEIIRPFDEAYIRDNIQKGKDLYREVWRTCQVCGKSLWSNDRRTENFVNGNIWGLPEILCKDPACTRALLLARNSDKDFFYETGRVVINGKVLEPPEVSVMNETTD